MKTVIITADEPEHRFVTRSLIESLGDHLSGVVIERGAGEKKSLAASLIKATRRYGAITVIERLITKLNRKIFRAKTKQLEACYRILGRLSPETYMPAKMPVLEVESANRNDCIKWIENIKPDYVFVYGTGIIGKKLLSLPSMGALNLHTGISPYYRGSDCAFWPLYNNEPLMLGSTVHKCKPELDGGDIYGRVSIRLSKDDDPYTAFAKAVEAGTSLYSNIAKRLVGGEEVPSEKQDFSKGKEYRFTDKTFVQELIMEFRVSSGKIEKIIADAEDSSLPFCDAK